MAILKFIPPPAKVRDSRGNEFGYYEAVCDVCGTHFYPRRSSAKYCHNKCAVTAHRKAKAELLARGGTVSNDDVVISEGMSAKDVYNYLRENFRTHGKKKEILSKLGSLGIKDCFIYEDVLIYRESARKFDLYKN